MIRTGSLELWPSRWRVRLGCFSGERFSKLRCELNMKGSPAMGGKIELDVADLNTRLKSLDMTTLVIEHRNGGMGLSIDYAAEGTVCEDGLHDESGCDQWASWYIYNTEQDGYFEHFLCTAHFLKELGPAGSFMYLTGLITLD